MSEHTEESLASALQRTGDGACALASDGTVRIWNEGAERLLGYSAREAIGRKYCDLFGGYDGEGDRVRAFDMRTRTKAGRSLWLNVSVIPVPPRTVHLLRDVTAIKELGALRDPRRAAEASPGLTPRELEVLRLLSQGLNTARAADRLQLSGATVRNHAQNILAKLGVHSRLEAVAQATRDGLV
jgi:PAS domain S-box-containing protein